MQYPDDSTVLGQLLDSMHYIVQYSNEDFLFDNSTMDTKVKHFTRFKITQYKIFSVNNKDNTYSYITEYSYSKCFSVGTFLPDAHGSKGSVMHPGR